MSRIMLPQAMRVIVPPTGNEVVSMLKTTSLVIAVPYSWDLYTRTHDIGVSMYAGAVLDRGVVLVPGADLKAMVGQYYVERYFARGVAARPEVQRPTVETSTIGVVGLSSATEAAWRVPDRIRW